jgi:hypothetical protein
MVNDAVKRRPLSDPCGCHPGGDVASIRDGGIWRIYFSSRSPASTQSALPPA